VLGEAPPATSGPVKVSGLPIIELKMAQVPDYLDSTDIVRRVSANQVVPSPSGRWGERLSVGITRDLAATLSRRLPELTLETRGGYEPSRRLIVSVARFEISPDGRCVLGATWRLTTADGKAPAPLNEGEFVEIAGSGTDAAAAAAMSRAVEALAAQIAVTVRRDLPTAPKG
jgi:uncharacterized lipoprotein YmbA